MPVYEKKEFADQYQIKTKDLAKYIQRGKVVEVNGKIDTNDVINAAWCVNREQLLLKKEVKKENPSIQVSNEVKAAKVEVKKEIQPKFEFPPETKRTLQQTFEVEGKLKDLQLEKTENEIALQRERLQKIQGESVPTELVKALITQHTKSITVEFRNAADNLLMEISARHSISSEEMGALRAKLIEIINKAVNASVDETKTGLKLLVDEYSVKKGVGEREG